MTTTISRPLKVGAWFAISLALVTVLGPAGTDMYLSSLPDVVEHLNGTAASGQLTLTVYLLAMGAGQLVFGPITDAFGRRRPLLAALIVFLLSSVWAAMSPSMGILLMSRTLQGLAAALTLVVALSMVRDAAQGVRAAQLFALLMTIEGLAPVLAPTVGGFVDQHFGWRAVLLVLAGLAAIAFANSTVSLRETLPAESRTSLRLGQVMRTYGRIARDGQFLLPALGLSAVFFFLFAYIGGAPFIYQGEFGLSSDTFGLVFGGTGLAVMFGAIIAGRTVGKFGAGKLGVIGTILIALGALIGLILSGIGLGLAGIVIGMFVALLGVGIAEATLMALAMASQNTALGSTAALLGAFQLIISSAATPLAGLAVGISTGAWLGFLLGISLVAFIIVGVSIKRAPAITDLGSH
ncbi:Bcr/CflA family drug resistance efflux transporter [Arthrobacter sp. MYb211]|uniref:multidrug effflux MFS transporter n=1 Tax=Micrococcaceae TaxID=1268 RepID=UPI000CFCA6AC|nr:MULTISPECIES: multidrug effflux MFS transporter [unclassified Arthrobacter]PQZ98287.1 Bcr/CflA family drug resistance efflux transporter [Arthrobacter sp. MYb224]PQZ98519.1 Bcr/CflA family drug resistance efflux transporter [Arthrobacter sp. MYb229]PRA09935.1 Bcr/CflA family drug resistance efflux transporter [Arthrobacter sp. MYb221]PRB47239.1 Bcr/CflA family drug resistance efflux transporter [Arthrobacter sp. MYb216]PRC05016.1 Bcr/CflA family drug resistance efflux transporter [Arthrobac